MRVRSEQRFRASVAAPWSIPDRWPAFFGPDKTSYSDKNTLVDETASQKASAALHTLNVNLKKAGKTCEEYLAANPDPKDAWFTPENKELCKAPLNAVEKTASAAYEHWWSYMHYNTHSMKTLLEQLLKNGDGKLEGALKSLHLTKEPLDKEAPPKHAAALLSAALAAHKGAERASGQLEGSKDYADEKDHRAIPLNSFISLWKEGHNLKSFLGLYAAALETRGALKTEIVTKSAALKGGAVKPHNVVEYVNAVHDHLLLTQIMGHLCNVDDKTKDKWNFLENAACGSSALEIERADDTAFRMSKWIDYIRARRYDQGLTTCTGKEVKDDDKICRGPLGPKDRIESFAAVTKALADMVPELQAADSNWAGLIAKAVTILGDMKKAKADQTVDVKKLNPAIMLYHEKL